MSGTMDGRLISLDAKTGKVQWDITVAEYAGTTEATSQLNSDDPLSKVAKTGSTGVGISAAPLVYDGKVFVGIAGVGYGLHPDQGLAVVGVSGQYGRPGLFAAFDAKTGKPVWHFDVTGPGWQGGFSEKTPDGFPLNRNIPAERAGGGEERRGVAVRRRLHLLDAGHRSRAAPASSSAPAIRRRRWPTPRVPATTSTPHRWWRSIIAPASWSGTTSRCRMTGGATTSRARRCCSR